MNTRHRFNSNSKTKIIRMVKVNGKYKFIKQ